MEGQKKFVFLVMIGVVLAWFAGDYFLFYLDNDWTMGLVGYPTLIICTVIAICTCKIINNINKK